MQIANPIYDVVFKYLMEDTEIAKLIIGTIIGEDIVVLKFLPQESTIFSEARSLTVYRLDFSAKIKLPDGGQKQVLIEIQKAKFSTDIMRFRRYLGEQYQNKSNTYLTPLDDEGKTERQAIPIVTIYFLGYPLEYATAPIIKVTRHYYDATTGEEIQTREKFIESLTHDSYVIQIPHLRPQRKSDIEQLLTIFDQRRITVDKHIMTINESNYPEPYWSIIRRLQEVIATPEVRRTMHAEDEILEELAMMEREIERKNKLLVEQQQALSEKDKVVAEQQQILSEKDKLIEELQKRLESLA
ncbi:hypothetical protein QUF64_06925 [Anaerolineales bacterium HSG6]|nr:hypothetical protein [Anaerolineales bacterium HSG6]MDM8531807.1 hypothetical protein [Anaerolineales bacterium HSG25]